MADLLKVLLNNLRFHSHIGVYPEEKKIGQDLGIDISIETNIDYQTIHEDLTKTLSYGDVYRATAAVVAKSRVDLLETLAYDIITTLKTKFGAKIAHVEVTIRKFNTPIDGVLDNVAIEVRD